MAITKLFNPNVAFNIHANTVTNNTAQTIKETAGTVYSLKGDNTANGAQINYVKLYFSNVTVVVGTTVPDFVLMLPAATAVRIHMPNGLAFALGLQESTVTTGGTTGSTSPTSSDPLVAIYA